MSSRFEHRKPSVRSLPKGQFDKYRQMFDTMLGRNDKSKKTSNEKQKSHLNTATQVKIINEEINENTLSKSSSLTSRFVNSSTQTIETDENEFNQKEMSLVEDEDIKNLIGNITSIKNQDNDQFLDLQLLNDDKFQMIQNAENKGLFKTEEDLDIDLSGINDLNSIFDGISSETNSILKNLCVKNKQIAKFLGKTNTTSISYKSDINYKLFPIEIDKLDDDKDSGIRVVNNLTSNKSNSSSLKFNDEISEASKSSMEYLESINGSLTRTSEGSRCLAEVGYTSSSGIAETNYLDIDEVEFSDESYDTDENCVDEAKFDADNLSYSRHSNTIYGTYLKQLPPPKPARTFEHDLYVESKQLNTSYLANFTYKLDIDIDDVTENKTSTINSIESEHIYEPLSLVSDKYLSGMNPRSNESSPIFHNKSATDPFNAAHVQRTSKLTLSEPNLYQMDKKRNKNEVTFCNIDFN